MKLINAFTLTSFFGTMTTVTALPDKDNESLPSSSSKPSLRASVRNARTANMNTKRALNGNSSSARANAKGQLLAKGNFGTIDISSDDSAKNGAKDILDELSQTLPGLSKGKTIFLPISSHQSKNSKAKHVRVKQQVHRMTVEGASLMVHTDETGEVIGINGELVRDEKVPKVPTIGAGPAIKAALEESRVPSSEHSNCNQPKLTVVRRLEDGATRLAWTCTVRYDLQDENGHLQPFNDQVFAEASGSEAGLIQIHPLIANLNTPTPTMQTRNCNKKTRNCGIVSTSSTKINTGDLAIDSAHNYAIDTFNYYYQKHGRNSINGAGMTLVSDVHYDRNYVNAFWDGSKMTYGDGDGVVSKPLSQDADVVAHELTHGVTERESGLIYQNESGALNEALSDIFGALVEHFIDPTITDKDLWLVGEDIWLRGEALRNMCDPTWQNAEFQRNDRDHYDSRYTGTDDNGGVHWNSGIANLAACLMVTGGSHPQGTTSNSVTPLGADADRDESMDILGEIFYGAQTGCLTSGSNFAAIRYCTAEIFGGDNKDKVNAAWDAVGVPNEAPPASTPPIAFDAAGTYTDQAADSGGVQQYTMDIASGSQITCSTSANNGDADLYVRFGAEAEANSKSTNNDCASYSSNSHESCSTGFVTADTTVYAAVHAYNGYTGLTISCSQNTGNCPKCGNGDVCCSNTCATSGPPRGRGCL